MAARRKYRKITLEGLRVAARELGGRCLSRTYVNSYTKMEWRCAEGHRWQTTAMSILLGHWCARCRRRAKPRTEIPKKVVARAKERGGKLVSKVYEHSAKPLRWRCARGHEWEATWNSIRDGSWCPPCGWTRFVDHAEARRFAKRHRGLCLSTGEIALGAKLAWKCEKGHEFQAALAKLRRDGFCATCRTTKPAGSIEEMRRIALARGGRCLSRKYRTAKSPLRWECSEGHQFLSPPDAIKVGQWCRVCYTGEKPDLGQMKRIARSRRGRCLSDRYVNDRTKLRWRCHRKHTWEAMPNSIKRGSWCPTCEKENRRGRKQPVYGILDMQALAESKGGKCLSTSYSNLRTHLEWQCEKGHRWRTAPNVIRLGSWCPECDRLRRLRNPLYAVERGRSDVTIAAVPLEEARARRARRKPPFWERQK